MNRILKHKMGAGGKIVPAGTEGVYFIKGPFIGSGKISRRIRVWFQLHSQNGVNQQRKINNRQLLSGKEKRNIVNNKLTFDDTATKRAFEFWNKHRHPFVIHQKSQSITTARILSKLQIICKKYEQRQVIGAIEIGHRLFQNHSFVFFNLYEKKKIGLHQFLEFTAKEKRLFESWSWIKTVKKKHGIKPPTSWFDECLKGWRHVEKKYCRSFVLKDKHPEITEQAVKMMQRHLGRQLNDKGKQDCVKFSRMLVNFAKLNKLDYMALFDRVSDALNSFHTMKVPKVYYLTTDIFWSDTLPTELIRFNKNKYEDMNFISDKELLIK